MGKFPALCSCYWWYLILELGPTHQHHRTRASTNPAQRYSTLQFLDTAMHEVWGWYTEFCSFNVINCLSTSELSTAKQEHGIEGLVLHQLQED
jgi:hypothetical protein